MKPRYKAKRSGLEERFAEELHRLRVTYDYEADAIKYKVSKVRTYNPDFTCTCKSDSKKIFLETKGWFDAKDRQKMLDVMASNPDLDIRMIFERDNKINKNSTTRYSDWAKKHGIKFHVGVSIPDEWLKEMQWQKRQKEK